MANPKANIPISNADAPPSIEIPTSNVPNIGPVQENDARDNTSAMKKIPQNPLTEDLVSA